MGLAIPLRERAAAARAAQQICEALQRVRGAREDLRVLTEEDEPHSTDSIYLNLEDVERRLARELRDARLVACLDRRAPVRG